MRDRGFAPAGATIQGASESRGGDDTGHVPLLGTAPCTKKRPTWKRFLPHTDNKPMWEGGVILVLTLLVLTFVHIALVAGKIALVIGNIALVACNIALVACHIALVNQCCGFLTLVIVTNNQNQ